MSAMKNYEKILRRLVGLENWFVDIPWFSKYSFT